MFTVATTAPKDAGGGTSKQGACFSLYKSKDADSAHFFLSLIFNIGNILYQSYLAVILSLK